MMRMRGWAAAAAALVGFAVLAGTAHADQSYTDANGDAGPGTDITAITVRNDSSGLITIQVGSASPIVENHAVAIFVNADKNAATGNQGDEYWFFGGPLVGSAFFDCRSGTCGEATPASFSVGAAASNVTEFRINRADLGGGAGFDFAAVSISVDVSSSGASINLWDAAPENGYFSYDLALPQCANGKDDDGDGAIDASDRGCSSATDDDESDEPITIRAGKASVKPAKPKAGAKVVVSVPVTQVETSTPLATGTVGCTARAAGGKAFRGTGRVAAGRAVCTFKVPLAAKGKVVRGTVSVGFKTASAKAAFSFKVA